MPRYCRLPAGDAVAHTRAEGLLIDRHSTGHPSMEFSHGLGQEQPATISMDRTPKGLLHSDTCRMIYFGNSAEAVAGALSRPRPPWIA